MMFDQETAAGSGGTLGHQEGGKEVTGPTKYRFGWDQKMKSEGLQNRRLEMEIVERWDLLTVTGFRLRLWGVAGDQLTGGEEIKMPTGQTPTNHSEVDRREPP